MNALILFCFIFLIPPVLELAKEPTKQMGYFQF